METDTANGVAAMQPISVGRRIAAFAIVAITVGLVLTLFWQAVTVWHGAERLLGVVFGLREDGTSSSVLALARSGAQMLAASVLFVSLAHLASMFGSELVRLTLVGVERYKRERDDRPVIKRSVVAKAGLIGAAICVLLI